MDLSRDLLVEILVRLPAQALVRLMTVCKSWKSIITSSEFCSLHLSRNRHTSKILLITRDRGQCNGDNDNVPKEWYLLLNNDEHLPADPSWLVPFDFPCFQCQDLTSQHILGSINGLICISLIPYYLWGDVEANIPIVLWNPTIRRYIRLPNPTFSYTCNSSIEFGYDATTDDYKVMVIRRVGGSTTTTTPALEFHIYSLNSHAWRGGFKICPPAGTGERGDRRLFGSTGALAGGKMHWIVSNEINYDEVELDEMELLCKRSLYSFDVAEEVFAEMALPEEELAHDKVSTDPIITVVRDSLHLVQGTLGLPMYWTIWVKMDAGGSCDMYWKKLYRVDVTAIFVCFLKNGEYLMDKYPPHPSTGVVDDDHGVLAAYDPRARQFKDLEPLSLSQQRAFGSVRSFNHQESLVLLDR
ncbi:Unknown protein [Striga hermonthica]|uniref:F-box domain-containing protein n=1 Tax=Striga hermonthica TaxID=68872 RepID=A0A9N7R3J9_STRHE|nr:Unknown protein [Striga hermonthica]